MTRWQFSALDTWFFRESRPMESIGGSELQSGFPPSPRTVSGAIRYLVGKKHQVDWSKWNEADQHLDVKTLMGDANGYGTLAFNGPWLTRKTACGKHERLYPAPANLVAARTDQGLSDPVRLVVGAPRHCDMGRAVRLPEVAPADQLVADQGKLKLKGLGGYWVTAQTLQAVLAGECCRANELIDNSSLFEAESRLGIARSNITRTVEEGMLYQTRHVRPKQDVLLEMMVSGLSADDYESSGVVRLGGEGRGAAFYVEPDDGDVTSDSGLPVVSLGKTNACGIILTLLSPLSVEQNEEAYTPLPGFKQQETEAGTVWQGDIQNIALSLHCVVQGKAIREGGWDLANHCPREVQSMLPAGSVFYLTVDDGDIEAAMKAIHLQQLAVEKDDIALGRGLVAVGIWPDNEWVEKE